MAKSEVRAKLRAATGDLKGGPREQHQVQTQQVWSRKRFRVSYRQNEGQQTGRG